MKISKTTLINMLNPNPLLEKEIGFNSAVIQILQLKEPNKKVSNFERRTEVYKKYLVGYNVFSYDQLKMYDSFVIGTNTSLSAIKLHKELSNIGLKEAKNCLDIIREKVL